MVAGCIEHQTGTRQIHDIGGIGLAMPFTAAAAGMAAMSMAGFPLFLGFVGKEIMYKGALTEEVFPAFATAAALAANALMTAVAGALAMRPFWGARLGDRSIMEAPWPMWFGPLVLSAIGLGFGLIPDWVGRWLIEPAVLSFHGTQEEIRLQLFHGVNEPLLLSIVTLCLGALVYSVRRPIRSGVARLLAHLPATMEGAYDGILHAVVGLAERQTKVLQSGSLYRYLVIIIGTSMLTVGWALTASGDFALAGRPFAVNAWQVLLLVMMLAAAAVAVGSTSRLLAICSLGIIGAGIAMIFLSFGAPDVALTQLLVETLTLIIAAIVLLRLPPITVNRRLGLAQRSLSLLTACGSGVLVTCLLIAVGRYDVDRSVTAFYEQASYLKAHGRNIVNVILVDFRSLDTLGEIVVVAASALAALALVRKGKSS